MANLNISAVNALFDASPLPLLLFGVSGQVNFANRAAHAHAGQPVTAMNDNTVVKQLIRDATLGTLKLPYDTDIPMMDGSLMHGRFMSGPSGLDMAFVMLAGEDEGYAAQGMKLKDIMELLKAEVSPPIQYLLGQVDTLSTVPGTKLAQAADILQQRLSRLSDLIHVFGDEIVHTHDRIELLPLVQSVCDDLRGQAAEHTLRFQIAPPSQTLPPVYGNLRLLKRAFHECLDNAVTHSRQQTGDAMALEVEIRFTFSGQHVLVAIRNRGITQLKLSNQEKLRPFVQASPAQTPALPTPRLGLPLVQRIVALHGGNMRLSSVDSGNVQILMEFPTGAPLRGIKDLDKAQAEAYAKDLAQLMSRRKKEKA